MGRKLLLMLVLCILVSSTLVGCSPASSTPSPSTLTILSITKGNVLVMKAGTDSWTKAQVGTFLEVGDTIKTDGDSNAQITFFDGSTIELWADTEIKIVALDISDLGSKTITLEQTIGTTISRVTKLLDPASRYEIETPNGVAAVRGSSMIVRVFDDGLIELTNLGGVIWFTHNGVDREVPEGGVLIMRTDGTTQVISFLDLEVDYSDDIVTDLAIDKSDSSDPVDPGTSLTYSLQINNNGPSDSTDTVVIDALPSGVSFVSATDDGTYDPSSHTVSWTIGTLAKDTSTSLNVTVTVNESTPPGIITNVAMVSANENDSYSDNDIATEVTTISIVNNPPVAVDDSAITSGDTPVTIDVLLNDSDIDGDTLTVVSANNGTYGSVTNNGSNVTYAPNLSFIGTDSFTYTISDGKGGTDTATVNVTVTNTLARINIQIDTGPMASIYISDNTTGGWAIDEDTGLPVNGENHVTSAQITVVGGHSYYVWVGKDSITYGVKKCPKDWIITSAPVGDAEAAYGYAAVGKLYPVHFTIK